MIERLKRIILALMSLLVSSSFISLYAQWAITYGGGDNDAAKSPIQQTMDGGYIIAGYTESWGAGLKDIWVLKLYSDGTVDWQKTYGGNDDDIAYSIQQTSDGGYIVAGSSYSFHAGSMDIWILKLSSMGEIEWQKTYEGTSDDHARSIKQTNDGGYIVVGQTSSFGAGMSDIWVLKLSSVGEIEWQNTYGGNYNDYAWWVRQTVDGGYIVSGETYSFGDRSGDIWILKLSPTGEIEWQRSYGGSLQDWASIIQQTSDGGYVVAGGGYSFSAGDRDGWILKLSSIGDIEWQRTFGSHDYDYTWYIQQTNDGGYIIAGYTYSFGDGTSDAWIIKLSSDGENEWQKAYGGNYSEDYARAVLQTTDGGYVVNGYTESWGAGQEDIWVLKLSPSGEINPGCVFIRSTEGLISQPPDAIPMDTNIIPMDTNIEPQDTNILPIDSDANVYQLCDSDICTLILSTSSGGTTNPEPGTYAYDIGAEVTLRAKAKSEIDNEYTFIEWTGNVQTSANPITITMDGNKTINAGFDILPEWGDDDTSDRYRGDGNDGWGGGSDWGGGGNECFIATAAYGSMLHPYVKILRDFRDRCLLPSKLGRALIKIYYKYSPCAADLISKHKVLKVAVRISLLPLIAIGYSSLHLGPIITTAVLIFIFMLPFFFIWRYQRKLKRHMRRKKYQVNE